MKGIDVQCPECGTINKSLFLEETEGTYECEQCGYSGKIEGYGRKIFVIRAGDIKKEMKGNGTNGERLTPLTV